MPCSDGHTHDWADGEQSSWCVKCWLVTPRRAPGANPLGLTRADTKVVVRPAQNQGKPHKRPWKAAREAAQTACCYCRRDFTSKRPPTFDHKLPRHAGGTLERDGWVLACQECNGARGPALYEVYMREVELEWAACEVEGRDYRPPKFVQGLGVVRMTRKQLTALKADRKALRRAAAARALAARAPEAAVR